VLGAKVLEPAHAKQGHRDLALLSQEIEGTDERSAAAGGKRLALEPFDQHGAGAHSYRVDGIHAPEEPSVDDLGTRVAATDSRKDGTGFVVLMDHHLTGRRSSSTITSPAGSNGP
jgi:hypothetical protein